MYVTLQPTARWSYDPKVRSAEIYDIQSSERNKILTVGENGVCNMEIYTAVVTNLAFSKAVELA